MKKSIFIFSLLAVALLFTGAGGCLEKYDANAEQVPDITTSSGPDITISSGYVNSVFIYERDGCIIANIQIIIQGTYAQTLDRENITVTLNGNKIEVFVPVITKDGRNTRDFGYETVEVILGKADDFNNEKHDVIVNGNENTSAFIIEEGTVATFVPAPIENIEIKTDGKNVTAVVRMAISGSQSVDSANIIKSAFQNEYDIFIPMKTVGSIITLDINWVSEEIVLGELSQLEDGIYTISINEQTTSFEIKNSTLID